MIGVPRKPSGSDRGYHHGNLREALVEAGVELARAGGPNAVVLRAATRQAGVSHNAAYRHFANQEDLLAAVADRCLNKLGTLMLERADRVRIREPARRAQARLNAIGRAYIEFARTEPGWFRAAFTSARPHEAPVRPGLTPHPDGPMPALASPFAVLNARLDELVDAGAMSPERRQGAEFAAWSGVHGLSSLLLDGPLRELPEPAVERAIDVVLHTIERGLR